MNLEIATGKVLEDMLPEIRKIVPGLRYKTYQSVGKFDAVECVLEDANNKWVSVFQLTEMPGNPWIVVSHNVSIRTELRGKGLGQLLNLARIRIVKEAGRDFIVCTVNVDNLRQRHILLKNGWTPQGLYRSKQGAGWVEFWRRYVGNA